MAGIDYNTGIGGPEEFSILADEKQLKTDISALYFAQNVPETYMVKSPTVDVTGAFLVNPNLTLPTRK